MWLFGRQSTAKKSPDRDYRSRYFQSRIRKARGYKRVAGITPKAQKAIRFRPVSIPGVLIGLLVLAIVLVVLYYLAVSDYFLVKNIGVEGSIQTNQDTVRDWILEEKNSKSFLLIPKTHQIAISRSGLEQTLKQKSPYISAITEMSRTWPDGLKITLEERSPAAIWGTGGTYFYIDNQSYLYEQLPASYATSTASYFVITDLIETPRAVGDSLEIDEAIGFLSEVSTYFGEKFSVGISEVMIAGKLASEVAVKSGHGWTVYFDMQNSVTRQLNSLNLIINQEIPKDRVSDLVYIDLRLSSAAYYCYQEEPCAPAEPIVETPEPVE